MAEISREQAYGLLCRYTKSDNLIKHALSVEAAMRYMAGVLGGEPDEWGVIGLIHDLDYDMYPDEHCKKTQEILQDENWPPEYIRAVMCHGYGLCTDEEPQTDLEKTLYAVDELTGLITAVALVRPSRSLMDLGVKSVKKKWKDKAFAAGANREVITDGAGRLGMELDVLIGHVIEGMKTAAGDLGLAG